MENNLTYTRNGDYLIPNLTLSEQPSEPLGKYGRMRKAYLKEHRPLIYNQMLFSCPSAKRKIKSTQQRRKVEAVCFAFRGSAEFDYLLTTF